MKSEELPTPDDYSGTTVEIEGVKWKEGTLGKKSIEKLKQLTNIPLDPTTNKTYYYAVSEGGNGFMVKTQLENNMKQGGGKGESKEFLVSNFKLCGEGYHNDGGACIEDGICGNNKHLEGEICKPNTQICYIANGNGKKIYNQETKKYGPCTDIKCDIGYKLINNKCFNDRSCNGQTNFQGYSPYILNHTYNFDRLEDTQTETLTTEEFPNNTSYKNFKYSTKITCNNELITNTQETETWTCFTNYTKISNSCYEKCGIDLYRNTTTDTTCSPVGNGYYSVNHNDTRSECTNKPANTEARTYNYTSSGNGKADGCSYDYTQNCGIDLYEVNGNCIAVGIGYYSANKNNTRYNCTNTKPSNSHYTSAGNGLNNCNWGCNANFHKVGNSCVYNTQTCVITNGTGKQTWNTSTNSWNTCIVQTCNANYHKVGNTCVYNSKQVACNKGWKPGNSSHNNYNVTITWNTSTNSWNTPANCSWSCNLDYYKSGNNCLWVGNGHYSPNKNNTRYNCNNKPANTNARTYYYTSDGNGKANGCSYSYSQNCGIDYYEVNGQCRAVGNGHYSLVNNNGRGNCNNKPSYSYYTSDGNGKSNGCNWTCNGGYYKSGNSCKAYTYTWYTSGWGSCSASPRWGGWSGCSASCGRGTRWRSCYGTRGNKTRTVYCRRNDGTKVSDSYCGGGKPGTSTGCSNSCSGSNSTSCRAGSCVTYSWVRTGRGNCNTSCGWGRKYGVYRCKSSNGGYVSDRHCSGIKPSSSTSCHHQPAKYKSCSGGNLRWYDSCWNRLYVAENCPYSQCSSGVCSCKNPSKIIKYYRGGIYDSTWLKTGYNKYTLQHGSCAGISKTKEQLFNNQEGGVYSSGCNEWPIGGFKCQN